MKRLLFIMNPNAGTRKAVKYLADIIGVFNRADYEVVTFMTAANGDATSMAAEKASSVDLIVCAGGDGTLNETINGVLSSGCDVPIGYIPCGSTNDFGASLHLPTHPVKAAESIVAGEVVRYDIGKFGGRHFSYVASFGAFTKTSYATPQSVKNALGHVAYLLSSVQELSQIRKTHMRIETEDRVIEDEFIFGAISNSISVGGILTLDPKQVDMRDGKFELLLVRAPRDLIEISDCIRALQSQKYNCAMITFLSTAKLTVHADPSITWSLDGERQEGSEEILVENLKHAIGLKKKD